MESLRYRLVPVGVTNQYLRLVYRYRLVVPPGTKIKITTRYLWRDLGTGCNTNRYLRLIHKFHPPQNYRYGDEPVPMLHRYRFISIPVLLGWT